jgi:ATP-dependent Clp protease ATP-binding subunit ClpC
MFERFTDRARKVMALANTEAHRRNNAYIGTEHLLLAIIKEGGGTAIQIFKRLNIDCRTIREEVNDLAENGNEPTTQSKLPQTARTKRVLEASITEARSLGHNYVGTEHLLLGLLKETDGIAYEVLTNVGLSSEHTRSIVLSMSFSGVPNDPPLMYNLGMPDVEVFRAIRAMALKGAHREPDHTMRRAFERLADVADHIERILQGRHHGAHT